MYKLKSILFLTCLHFSKIICEDYSVTPVTTSSGLYYEKIGEVLLSNNNWQFVTSVDYKGYLLFYEYLFQQAKQIEAFCDTFNSSTCKERYSRIQPILDRIEKTDESMAHFLGVTTRRVKRFWAEIGSFLEKIGGAVVRTIFGGRSNSVDVSSYNRAIGELQNGQRELVNQLLQQRTVFMLDSEKKNTQIAQLSKNQIDIANKIVSLEKSFEIDKEQKEKEIKELKGKLNEINDKIKIQEQNQKILNERVDKIEKNLLDVDKSIKEIRNDIEKNKKNINRLEVISQLNGLSLNFILLMDLFKAEQENLFEVIKKAKVGQLDPYVLTPSKLINMLVDILAHLPEGTKFPYYPNIENANKLYNIIKPSVCLFDYKVIFILNIPLVYSKTFNLNKMTSLPAAAGDNRFVFVLPQEPFMIIDNNYQDYMLMSINNFRLYCSKLEDTKYICRQVEETINSQYSEECEVKLFKSPRKIPETCDKRVMALDRPMFLQLQRERSWIYVFPTVENVIISCSNNRTTVHLIGTGFIHVNEDCLVLTPSGKPLQFFTTFRNPVESQFSAPINLTDVVDLTQFDDTDMKSVNVQNILPFELNKLEDVSYRISKDEVNLIPLYCALLVIIILVTVIVYLVYKKKITLDKLRNLLNKKRTPATILEENSDPENIKLKIKVKNQSDIQKVSIYGNPSENDPESEYLTVRFKVKKDQSEPSTPPEKIIQNNLQLQPPNSLPPKANKEDQYLSDLRKLKPKVNNK